MESNEDDRPKHGPIQSKFKTNYKNMQEAQSPKGNFDLIWPTLTKSAYLGYLMRTHPIYGICTLWIESLKSLHFHFNEILGQLA